MPGAGRKPVVRVGYLVVAALVLVNGGCLLVAAGVAGGATAGYLYYKGRLYHDYPANLADAQAAVRTSLLELQFPVLTQETDTGSAFVSTRTADGAKVRIHLDVVPSRVPAEGALTRVSIRVGAFGDESVSARILDQVGRHLAGPPVLGAPQPVPGPAQPPAPVTRPPETVAPPLAR